MVVLHYTAMDDAGRAGDWLCNPESEVSAHWLIGRDGTVVALVPEERRAWHAGAGGWGEVTDVNSRSIGIELDNDGSAEFPEAQVAALERLLAGILRRWAIPPERVIGHSDMAPGRKIDPGPRFPWARLAEAGLAVMPEVAGDADVDAERFARDLARIGYRAAVDGETLLAAFRLRFRPAAEGPLDGADCAVAGAMAARWPARAPQSRT